jgi:hypothetical protein
MVTASKTGLADFVMRDLLRVRRSFEKYLIGMSALPNRKFFRCLHNNRKVAVVVSLSPAGVFRILSA